MKALRSLTKRYKGCGVFEEAALRAGLLRENADPFANAGEANATLRW